MSSSSQAAPDCAELDFEEGAFEFPKTRLGNACAKNWGKCKSLVAQLMTDKWSSALKAPSLRGILRTVAGLSQELQLADSPALLQQNELTIRLIGSLVSLCIAANSVKRAEEIKHYMKFAEPAGELARAIEELFGPGKKLDPELQVLQATIAWEGRRVCV